MQLPELRSFARDFTMSNQLEAGEGSVALKPFQQNLLSRNNLEERPVYSIPNLQKEEQTSSNHKKKFKRFATQRSCMAISQHNKASNL